MIYFDSSILLAIYLSQPRADDAIALFDSHDEKVSSWLLAVEVPIVLRRQLGASHSERLAAALAAFDADLVGIMLRSNLQDVAARIRADAHFSRCRSLDAIHVASALLLREETGRPVVFATFDDEQRRLAMACDLGVL